LSLFFIRKTGLKSLDTHFVQHAKPTPRQVRGAKKLEDHQADVDVRQGEGRESHKGGRYGGAHQEAIAHTQVYDVEEQHAEGYQETGQ